MLLYAYPKLVNKLNQNIYMRGKYFSRTQYKACFWYSVYLSIFVPPEDAVYCPHLMMPPHPATDASELAKFEPLKHGFHEKPAFVLEELGSL